MDYNLWDFKLIWIKLLFCKTRALILYYRLMEEWYWPASYTPISELLQNLKKVRLTRKKACLYYRYNSYDKI